MTRAIRLSDARDAVIACDEKSQVGAEQVNEILGDLDEWNQPRDGRIDLQTALHDNKVRLSGIIHDRTGLSYTQAPDFYGKMESFFLDRSIPLAVPEEETSATHSNQAPASAMAVAALGITVAKPKPVLLQELKHRELVQGLIALVNIRRDVPLIYTHPARLEAHNKLIEGLLDLQERMDGTRTIVRMMPGVSTEKLFESPDLEYEREALLQSENHLKNMLVHYHRGGDVRESDLAILKRYTQVVGSMNEQIKKIASRLPTLLSTGRATAIVTPLRQSSQGMQTLLGRLSPVRGTVIVAGIVAIGGLMALGFEAAARATEGEPAEALVILEMPKAIPVELKAAELPKGSLNNPIYVEALPNEVWSIEELPKARQ